LLKLHQPKKVPPPTPEGHEGRLFPPEQSFKSEAEIPDLTSACKKKILPPSGKKFQPALTLPREARRSLRNRLSLRCAGPSGIGLGWDGWDERSFSNHNFIAAAAGIEPSDVTAIHDSFYPRQATAAQMTTRLELVGL
jgi:hypothetical protein